jgi:Outer membrane protein V
MHKRILPQVAAIAIILVTAFAAQAEENKGDSNRWGFNLGVGATVSTSEYRGVERLGTALPLLGYEGEWLYLRGLNGGVHLFKNENHELNVQLSYLPQHFTASWSENSAIKKLDDRYSTAMAGINYRLRTDLGVLAATLSTDALGVNNGLMGEASYSYPIRLVDMSIIPALGVQWTDANYNDYYYGVSKSEAQASGLSHYSPEGSVAPYGELTMRLGLTERWSVFVNGKALFLGDEVSNSPMVEHSNKYSLSGGFLYAF